MHIQRNPITRIATAALALVVVLAALVAGGRTAAAMENTFTAEPAQVAPGGAVVLTAYGFLPGEPAVARFVGSEIGTGTADEEGVVVIEATIPSGAPLGTHPLDIEGWEGSFSEGDFTVVAAPAPPPPPTTVPACTQPRELSASASPAALRPTETFLLTGYGFCAGERVEVRLGNRLETVQVADQYGAVRVELQVPGGTTGRLGIALTGAESGTVLTAVDTPDAASAPPAPRPVPQPEPCVGGRVDAAQLDRVTPGETRVLRAGRFCPNELVDIGIDGDGLIAVGRADGTGGLEISLLFPRDLIPGTIRLELEGYEGSHGVLDVTIVAPAVAAPRPQPQATCYKSADAHIRFAPGALTQRAEAVVYGQGWCPTEGVTVKAGDVALATVDADAAGAFQVRFTVPAETRLGLQLATATGDLDSTTMVNVTVLAAAPAGPADPAPPAGGAAPAAPAGATPGDPAAPVDPGREPDSRRGAANDTPSPGTGGTGGANGDAPSSSVPASAPADAPAGGNDPAGEQSSTDEPVAGNGPAGANVAALLAGAALLAIFVWLCWRNLARWGRRIPRLGRPRSLPGHLLVDPPIVLPPPVPTVDTPAGPPSVLRYAPNQPIVPA